MSIGQSTQTEVRASASGARKLLRRVSKSLLTLKKTNDQPHKRITLNYDAIAQAMEYLALPDLLRTMATCRSLYDLGIPILLRDVRFVRSRGNYQSRFLLYRKHFLTNPIRFAWVQSLACPSIALDDRIYTQFLAMPRNFTSLQALDMDMNGAEVDNHLSRWILSLERLRELKIQNVGAHSEHQMGLLQRIGPRLKVLHISTEYFMRAPPHFYPLRALASSTCSLCSLSFCCSYPEGGPAISNDDNLSFPAVQEVTWISAEVVSACALISAFPGLRRLYVADPKLEKKHIFAPRQDTPADVILNLRMRNRSMQHCHRARWQSLDVLRGSPVTLWALAFRCRVVRLETALCNGFEKPGYTLAILHDVWPEHLVLGVSTQSDVHLDRVLEFPSLRTVELTFTMMDSKGITQILTILTWPIVFKPGLWLDSLEGLSPKQRWFEKPPVKRRFPACWRVWIPKVVEAMPLLEYLKVDIWGYRPFTWEQENDAIGAGASEDAASDITVGDRFEPALCACVSSD
ncbi:uncharacterized protein PHACADRAFT_184894 [Phanerochaete carnosa HHB-10118-sp]|uniref:F-box domain-containing protein n=1 Tax=Phanerochaete carnosa (strain HHB-10118-sp) TaxID=650164 RepID=K5V162_PHACS|nr:uncharacterized protein PHACADRAFT_184894 [Phanerochaete carnosa HHB-10118-sp]EKM56226.1 hypothetical protein PHACADRAFT_184894 [Phanerochaete carnosa HHB-10118-sp]